MKNKTYNNEKNRIDQAKQTTEFSQTYSMKSMGSSWENLTIGLGLKGLIITSAFLFV